MLTFLINLDSSTHRMLRMQEQLEIRNIKFTRIPAINGKELSEHQIQKLSYPINDPDIRTRFTRDLTPGEIGCFLSHRMCWKKLLASKHEWALIMEDDILISSQASSYMKSCEWIPNDVKICQLSCLHKTQYGKIGSEIKTINKNFSIVNPIAPAPLGTQAYFISREFATEAIRLSEKLPAPVDDFLFSPWFSLSWKFKIWRINPTLVIPYPESDSDIGHRGKKHITKAPFFLRHGLKRFLLDKKIKQYQTAGTNYKFDFLE